MNKEIRFYHPLPRFPSVSITGSDCKLGCNHCRGYYLKNMPDVSTPEKLIEFCLQHERNNGVGLLISGGSTCIGQVPLEPFLESIEWIKENTGLILNIHTGLVDAVQAESIASTGVDIVSVDLVGSKETIRNVYGLNYSEEEYTSTLFHLRDAGVKSIAPHITVGLDYGKINGEYNALEYATRINPEVIVFLGLIPTKDTPMENIAPPSINEILELISAAKEKKPKTSISLGCMRSRMDKYEMEWRAIEAGVDRIASSSRGVEQKARNEGLNVKIIEGCCSIPEEYEDKYNLIV